MGPGKIKKDENTEIEISRVPSKNPNEHDDLDLEENTDTAEPAKQTESLKQKSDRDRSQGNETIGIP